MFGAGCSMADMIGIESLDHLAFYLTKPDVCDVEGDQGQGYGGVIDASVLCVGGNDEPYNHYSGCLSRVHVSIYHIRPQ